MLQNHTLAALLEARATDTPDALAFAMGEETLSYAQLRDDAARVAASLFAAGIEAGDRVALSLPPGLELVRAYFAVQRLGAAPCIFDPSVPAETAAKRIARIRPKLTIDALANLPHRGSPLPPLPDDEEAVAFLQSTSGTSGEPRAAVVLQRQALASLSMARELFDPAASDVLVGWVPPWHDLGLLRFILGPIAFGIPCHLVPPAIRTIPLWFSTIATARGTITGAPDFAYRLAARLVEPRAVDLRSLRYATNGGEPVRASTIELLESRFGIPGVIRAGYGLAEATLGVTSMRPGDAMRVDARGNVSCGRPIDGVEVRVEADEILVRSPAVFAGYFDAEDASRNVLRDGWLYTGDIGHLDSEGHLYVLGRKRAMLKRGGVPLAPRELEEAAQTVDGIRVAAATGLRSRAESVTEEIVVAVELDPQRAHDDLPQRVSEAIEKALGFAPDRVVVFEPRTIPRTTNGKIRHDALRQQLEAMA